MVKSNISREQPATQTIEYPCLMEFVGGEESFIVRFSGEKVGMCVYSDHADWKVGNIGSEFISIHNTDNWKKFDGTVQLHN